MFGRVAAPSHSDFGASVVSPRADVQIRVKPSVGLLYFINRRKRSTESVLKGWRGSERLAPESRHDAIRDAASDDDVGEAVAHG
jgi:hypothetical protein